MPAETLSRIPTHAAIIVDGKEVFIGSQSLRKLELDSRREIGVICREAPIAKRAAQIFERDWEAAT